MNDKFIVAHPDSVAILDTLEEARKRGDKFRETRPIVIYKLVEVERWMPIGAPPPAPTPPPVGDVEVRAA